jgi:uncharacterized protein (TIGR03435 family)
MPASGQNLQHHRISTAQPYDSSIEAEAGTQTKLKLLWIGYLALSVGASYGQALPQGFEVAVIKVNPTASGGMRHAVSPGGLTMTNVSLGYCIRWAYNVQDYEIIAPDWTRFEIRYFIAAKAGEPVPEDQLKLMLQQLLAERFKLTLHHEKRELPAYALVLAKGGIRMHRSASEGESTFKPAGPYAYAAKNIPITRLLQFLGPPAGASRPVVDRTGLEGAFDFTLDLGRYLLDETGRPTFDSSGRVDYEPALMRGLSEQLGLKLEPIKSPFDVLVIDHVEKTPSQN